MYAFLKVSTNSVSWKSCELPFTGIRNVKLWRKKTTLSGVKYFFFFLFSVLQYEVFELYIFCGNATKILDQ